MADEPHISTCRADAGMGMAGENMGETVKLGPLKPVQGASIREVTLTEKQHQEAEARIAEARKRMTPGVTPAQELSREQRISDNIVKHLNRARAADTSEEWAVTGCALIAYVLDEVERLEAALRDIDRFGGPCLHQEIAKAALSST